MNIRENMGVIDRFIRIGLAIFFVVAYFHGLTGGALGIISLVVAVSFIANAIFGVCFIYRLLGIRTQSLGTSDKAISG